MHDGNLYNSVETNTLETPERNLVGWNMHNVKLLYNIIVAEQADTEIPTPA